MKMNSYVVPKNQSVVPTASFSQDLNNPKVLFYYSKGITNEFSKNGKRDKQKERRK